MLFTRKLIPIFFFLLASTFLNPADAACRWVVHGNLQGMEITGRNEQVSWPIANTDVRIQSRWTSGGWWNSINWPAITTSNEGTFTIQSANLLPEDCMKNREIRLQLPTGPWGEWQTHLKQTFVGPAIGFGDHHVHFGNENCVGVCSGQVITLHDVNRPRAEQVEQEEKPEITATKDECVARRSNNMVRSVDLTFLPLPSSDWLTTEDGLLQLTRRYTGDTLTHSKLTLRVNIQNNSDTQYKKSKTCSAIVDFSHNEGPGRRLSTNNDNPWRAWSKELDSMTGNSNEIMTQNTKLYGAGVDDAGEWNEDYDYTILKIHIDSKNYVKETDKDNNIIEYCYHIPEHQFVNMTHCSEN